MSGDRPRWAIEGRGWPLAEHSRFATAGGLHWHYQQLGRGPALLLLHGTGAATHSWRALAPLLARDFTVIAPDLPGHGFTDGRPPGGHGLPAITDAVATLIDGIGVEISAIIGHSAGAAVGIRMALGGFAPPAGVIGLSPALLPFPGIARKLFPAFARLLFVNPFAPALFARIARSPGETRRFLERSTGSTIDAEGVELYARLFGRAGHCAGALAMMADWDLEPLERDLPNLAVPTLLIHGERDAAIPVAAVRRAAAAMQAARIDLLPGLGHLAHEERPDLVADRIAGFLAPAQPRPMEVLP